MACNTLTFPEKLADEPVVVVKPPKPAAVNKWEGEDEDEVKVSEMQLLIGCFDDEIQLELLVEECTRIWGYVNFGSCLP